MKKTKRPILSDSELFTGIRELIVRARETIARNVNTIQVMTYHEIGRRIVEHEQGGARKADYGQKLVKSLSIKLTREFGKGFSKANLEYMRRFYLIYPVQSSIAQTASGQCLKPKTPLLKHDSFQLSWSHYVFLMALGDQAERRFYEIEAYQQNWSLRELKRQFNSSLYERLALSRNKEKVAELSLKGQIVEQPQDVMKNPYVLEFLGLDEREKYSESDLETAIINKLEDFLLELGKGFLFQARQKRFTIDEDHFYVDLVFYNRLLRCYVLIDLKIGEITHQDLGQMQMYVNYFDQHEKANDENQTVGIILCRKKREALVAMTLPPQAQIHAREYKLYLPSKAQLKRKLMDWTKD